MDVNVDWAGRLPGSVLLDIATYHLSLSDIKCASQVCQRWNSVLSLCCRRVVLKPFRSDARRGSRPTAAERYPTHLFCRRDTVCLLPLSKCRISAMDAHDLEIFASVLSDYRLPLLNVHYSVDEVAALRTRAEGAQRALEAARRARQAAVNRAHSRTAPAVLDPHPQQPYYALSVPLVTTLTSLLRSPRQPGRNLRRLVLRLTALPEPRALFSLALLPSLESLELIGGPAAFLEHSHLEALDALRGLKELTVEGVWDEVRRQYSDRGDLVQGGGGGGGGAGPAAAPWIHLDAMNPWEQGLANLQGADVGVEMEMQQPAPAAALQAHFWAAAGGLGGNGEAPWPEFFTSLEHLRVLRLRAINASDTAMAAAAAGFRRPTPLRLDLYLLTGLQALSVVGWQLDPGLSRMGQLQRLTHLQTDRVLSVAEWTVVRGLEGLAEAVLRAEVAGYMGQPKLIGGSVFLHYGNDQRSDNHGQLDFPLPPELRGDRSKAGGAAAATSGGTVSGGGASAAVGNLFLAGAGGMEEQRCSSSFRQRIKDLAEAHVQLEPLRFLSENTCLTKLSLRWRSASATRSHHAVAPGEPGGGGGQLPTPAVSLRPEVIENALLARQKYVRHMAALSELQDVELCCPGGELVLDATLLRALAPAWRVLRRLKYTGVVAGLSGVDEALGLFRRLQELGLYPTNPSIVNCCGTGDSVVVTEQQQQQQHQHQQQGAEGLSPSQGKLLLRTDRLPSGLQRLSLCHVDVLHIPGVGVRGLQRLELQTGSHWFGGAPSAAILAAAAAPIAAAAPRSPPGGTNAGNAVAAASPASSIEKHGVTGPAVAGPHTSVLRAPADATATPGRPRPVPGPWLLFGVPLLTHLDITAADLGPSELKPVLLSCGSQLRSLCLSIPEAQAQAPALMITLSEAFNVLLPKLAHLSVVLREPQRCGIYSVPEQASLFRGQDMRPADDGRADDGGSHSHFSFALSPVRQLMLALMPAATPAQHSCAGDRGGTAAGSGGGSIGGCTGRLTSLRELVLNLPWCGLSDTFAGGHENHHNHHLLLLPHELQQLEEQQQRFRQHFGPALVDTLASLGQLTQLTELKLSGPLIAHAVAHLERWALIALPHCHVDLSGAFP